MVRRLPVLQNPETEDAAAEARSPSTWVAIGAGLVLVLFLPLSVVGVWVGARLSLRVEAPALAAALRAVPALLAFAIAAGSAGAFVGRFGRRTGPGSALLAGALGGLAISFLAALGGALSPWVIALSAAVVLVGLGSVFAALGARWGRSRRPGVAPR